MVDFIDNNSTLLKDAIRMHLSDAKEALFALAFVRNSGVNMIVSDLEKMIGRGGKVSILFANDFGATEGGAIDTLLEVGVKLKFYSKPNSSFHLKAYLFKRLHSEVAIIGSSNLSASGLTTGTEWSICVKSGEIDFHKVLSEFQKLWESEYSKNVSNELVYQLDNQKHSEDFRKTIQEEDRYSVTPLITDARMLLNDRINYVVKRKPTNQSAWFFQVYKNQLAKRSLKGSFNIVVVCDYQSSNQIIFLIPYSFLKDNILPFAHLEQNGRYLFNVRKSDYSFNWNRSIKMDGKIFMIK